MDLRNQNFPFDQELGEDWRPKIDFVTSAKQALPWLAGLAVFVLIVTLVGCIQEIWSGSPIFHIIRFIGRLILTIVAFLFGLIRWMFSANPQSIKNCIVGFHSEHASVFCPLILAIPMMSFIFGLVKDAEISKDALTGISVASGLTLFICLMIQTSWSFERWIGSCGRLIAALWG